MAIKRAGEFFAEVNGCRPPPSHPFIEELELALGEACSNCARHHNRHSPGEIRIEMSCKNNQLLIDIADRNEAFDPDTVPLPNFAAAPDHGYGLFLIRHHTDAMSYQRLGGWNILSLTKNIPMDTRKGA